MTATTSPTEDTFGADPGTARGTPAVTATLVDGRAQLTRAHSAGTRTFRP